MGNDANGNFFRFYDNASNRVSQGTSPLNKLYYNPSTGFISGMSQCEGYVALTDYQYRITQIRKSKPL